MFFSVRSLAGVAAALAVSAAVMVGCGGDDDTAGLGGRGGIVNANGEAWLVCSEIAGCSGYAFRSNKDAFMVSQEPGGGEWDFLQIGRWATEDENLTVTNYSFNTVMFSGTYMVSRNSLTLTANGSAPVTYTRTSGVNP
ncbi:MAG: hypothetical protein FWC23_09675 [Chitinispirillia bacterium]|nr:hypothetical protein [Chitinispirillia bacterium]MCL2269438.1 hypothetical protein [Chitinispirillia bacterium]